MNSDATEMQLPPSVGGDGKFSANVTHHGVSVGILRGTVSIVPHDYVAPLIRNSSTELSRAKDAKDLSPKPKGYIGNTNVRKPVIVFFWWGGSRNNHFLFSVLCTVLTMSRLD